VLLIVEVGDTSRAYDRKVKLPLYARSEIPEVWLVDLKDRVINVFRDLRDGEYRTMLAARPGESVACAAFPEECFPVDEIVG
jgi:Uma2 family endonuclease